MGGRDSNSDKGMNWLLNMETCSALHNPGLKAAFHRLKAALQGMPQARALPDPKFEYGYFIEEVETRVGAQRHSHCGDYHAHCTGIVLRGAGDKT